MIDLNLIAPGEWPGLESVERGGIVGRATLVDVIPPFTPEATIREKWPGVDPRWKMDEQFGFVLADVRPMPLIPCKGTLGFFEVPVSDVAELVPA